MPTIDVPVRDLKNGCINQSSQRRPSTRVDLRLLLVTIVKQRLRAWPAMSYH